MSLYRRSSERNSMYSGTRVERSRWRTWAPSSSAVQSRWSCCSTMAAATTSPHSSSGMPQTPASATAGCSSSTSSISPGDMFSPPRMITSSRRPST